MEEIWKEITGTYKRKGREYILSYLVSNTGKVKAPERQVKHRWGGTFTQKAKDLVIFEMNRGYLKCAAGLVHQLVARAFIPNPNGYREVNHLDGNKHNNHVDNLEWTNHPQNLVHYFNSEDAMIAGNIHPMRVWDRDGNWIGDFPSKTRAGEFIGVKQNTISSYLAKIDNRRFIGKDCYIVREISYEQYKDEKKENFPTSRLPKDKRGERSKIRRDND